MIPFLLQLFFDGRPVADVEVITLYQQLERMMRV
jgi:hypothetical protein